MGYYSEVVFVIDKELYVEHKLIKNNFPKIWEKDPEYVYENTEKHIIFYISSIRWYDHFDEVKEAISFMDALDSDGCTEESYGFMRLGEEFGDIEERGIPYHYDIYANQHISIG